VFYGSSIGAHPALVHSHAIPGSVCVGKNPGTCISRYWSDYVSDYRRACWPGVDDSVPLSELTLDDVGPLYASGQSNTVILLQNATDKDVLKQFVPFLSHLPPDCSSVLPVIDYFRTELGHTYPLPELRRWVYGAVLAPSTAVLDIASAASVQHFANVRPHILDDGEPDVTVPSQPEAASTKHPYVSRAPRSYWKRAVGSRSVATLDDVWTPPDIAPGDRIVTAGSCFAQHIGSRLLARDATVLDVEPAPESIRDPNVARRHGYGLFSARYGNIYSSRQMVQLLDEAFGERSPVDAVWRRGARYFDALRPTVEPDGHDSADAVREARAVHLAKVRELFELMDVFVFTLGLTEIWESIEDETAYPTAPGTVCGEFDPARYRFRNLTWPEVAKDLTLLRRD
jgi:hypothetical protein